MTLHYHGTPITPRSVLHSLSGRFFCHSFASPNDTAECHRIGQGNMLDNGAYTVWRQGGTVDWRAWREWAEPWLEYHNTWAVLPDSITGNEEENDDLLREWQVEKGSPVWHLHEGFGRLFRLVNLYPRVCFGSSGAYATVGADAWHRRVTDAFNHLTRVYGSVPNIHMLRGMSLAGDIYPFASLDSTDVARNHNRDHNTAKAMAERWDAKQCPARWKVHDQQQIGFGLHEALCEKSG